MNHGSIMQAIFNALYETEGGWQNPQDRAKKAAHSAEIVFKKLQDIGVIVPEEN